MLYSKYMGKKTLLILIIGLIILGFVIFILMRPKNTVYKSPTAQLTATKEIKPSETVIEYTDPSGFIFSYPDNLSIVKNEIADNSTYADIQLNSKDASGSLNLKITDSKFTTIDDWINANKAAAKEPPKEVKFGNLKGMEIKTDDRLLTGALDKGVFFSIEMPLIETNFWMPVYNKLLANFSFTTPENTNSGVAASSDDVSFEGEEVVQ